MIERSNGISAESETDGIIRSGQKKIWVRRFCICLTIASESVDRRVQQVLGVLQKEFLFINLFENCDWIICRRHILVQGVQVHFAPLFGGSRHFPDRIFRRQKLSSISQHMSALNTFTRVLLAHLRLEVTKFAPFGLI